MEHLLDRDVERVLFSEEELRRRVAEIAAEIDRDYAGKEIGRASCRERV